MTLVPWVNTTVRIMTEVVRHGPEVKGQGSEVTTDVILVVTPTINKTKQLAIRLNK